MVGEEASTLAWKQKVEARRLAYGFSPEALLMSLNDGRNHFGLFTEARWLVDDRKLFFFLCSFLCVFFCFFL